MSLHGDLLEQARHLARREPKRPRQASLRRAVSAAYYALFHFLVDRSVRRFVRGHGRRQLQIALSRTFQHSSMKKAAKAFADGALKAWFEPALAGNVIQPQLGRIGAAFVDLQEARHNADYNLDQTLTRSEALSAIDQAANAMAAWNIVKDSVQADAFLTALLVYDKRA